MWKDRHFSKDRLGSIEMITEKEGCYDSEPMVRHFAIFPG